MKLKWLKQLLNGVLDDEADILIEQTEDYKASIVIDPSDGAPKVTVGPVEFEPKPEKRE